MTWPHETPEDLNRMLHEVMGFRSYAPVDIWAAVREWLEAHDVPAPDTLPERRAAEGVFDQ